VISHATADYLSAEIIAKFAGTPGQPWFRSREQVAKFFTGLQVLEPGVVSSVEWRVENEPGPRVTVEDAATHCAVARKP
jgi:hypothetical protein